VNMIAAPRRTRLKVVHIPYIHTSKALINNPANLLLK
jgi:hypothetical protein